MAILTFRTTKAKPTPAPDGQMALMDHIVELRTRLIRVVWALGIAAIIVWFLYEPMLHFLLGPLRASAPKGSGPLAHKLNTTLSTFGPLEPFQVRLKLTGYAALILAMPVILWQVWRFIAPGLYSNEKKYALWFVGAGTLLFAMGAAVAFLTVPKALEWLRSIGGSNFQQFYAADKYLQLIVYMMLAFGIGFEYPIVLVTLLLVGIVTTQQLIDSRRYAIVIVAVIVAVFTPSSDPVSMLALCIPMWIFYEIAILFGRLHDRRLRKRAAAA